MAIVLFALAAGGAVGAWKLYRLWRSVPRRNSDFVLF